MVFEERINLDAQPLLDELDVEDEKILCKGYVI